MQTILFPAFVALGMTLAALTHLVFGPAVLIQALVLMIATGMAMILLRAGDTD